MCFNRHRPSSAISSNTISTPIHTLYDISVHYHPVFMHITAMDVDLPGPNGFRLTPTVRKACHGSKYFTLSDRGCARRVWAIGQFEAEPELGTYFSPSSCIHFGKPRTVQTKSICRYLSRPTGLRQYRLQPKKFATHFQYRGMLTLQLTFGILQEQEVSYRRET